MKIRWRQCKSQVPHFCLDDDDGTHAAVWRILKEKGPFLALLVNILVWCVWHILQWIYVLRLCVNSFPWWIGLKNITLTLGVEMFSQKPDLCILYRQAIGNFAYSAWSCEAVNAFTQLAFRLPVRQSMPSPSWPSVLQVVANQNVWSTEHLPGLLSDVCHPQRRQPPIIKMANLAIENGYIWPKKTNIKQ